jgi:hypothetical protein
MTGVTFVIMLIVCLTVMHISTLVILFYKDRINLFLDGLSTDVIMSEMHKRGYITEAGAQRYQAAPQLDGWQRMDVPNPVQTGPTVPMRYLPSQQQQKRSVQPMEDGFAYGSAPVDQFQEFLHPAYGYGCGGRELRSDEGMVGSAGTPSWDVAMKPVVRNPQNCKNYNNITIC